MVRVRVRLGYTMVICLLLQHQVSPGRWMEREGPMFHYFVAVVMYVALSLDKLVCCCN